MDSAADKTVAQILKTAFMKSSYFVTSALISVWLMVLLFMTHIDILSVKSRYSHCPEVLRKSTMGLENGGGNKSEEMWEIRAPLLLCTV